MVQCKNRFAKPHWNGYADTLWSIRIETDAGYWHVCELQVHLASMLVVQTEHRHQYETFRGFFPSRGEVVAQRMGVIKALFPDYNDLPPPPRVVEQELEARLNHNQDHESPEETVVRDAELEALAELFGESMCAKREWEIKALKMVINRVQRDKQKSLELTSKLGKVRARVHPISAAPRPHPQPGPKTAPSITNTTHTNTTNTRPTTLAAIWKPRASYTPT